MTEVEYHPFTGEPSNHQRAMWAMEPLDRFTRDTMGPPFGDLIADGSDGDGPDAIGDLIGDLLHVAHLLGWDAEKLARRGLDHFRTEVFQEEAVKDEGEFTSEFADMFNQPQAEAEDL